MKEIKETIKENGEKYCLEQLLNIRKNAFLAENSNQPDWDIKILDGSKTTYIQVKTNLWESNGDLTRKKDSIHSIKGQFKNNKFDYLVLILLNFNKESYTSYVIPSNKLKEKGENDREKLIDEGYVYYSTAIKEPEKDRYEDQTISISTLKYKEKQDLFDVYLNKFDSIITAITREDLKHEIEQLDDACLDLVFRILRQFPHQKNSLDHLTCSPPDSL